MRYITTITFYIFPGAYNSTISTQLGARQFSCRMQMELYELHRANNYLFVVWYS